MQKKRKKLSLLLKIIISVSIFLLGADVFLGVVLMNRSINKMKDIINNKILEIALTARELINGDEVETLTIADKQNQTDAYVNNLAVLDAFKTSGETNNAELAYIYALVKNDEGKYVFSLDPSPEGEESDFLIEETIRTPALVRAFEKGKAGFDSISYVDRWGDLYSAYAPVFSKNPDHHVTCVIGVDIWASWYNTEVSHNAVSIGIISGVTLLLGVGLSIIITFSIRKKFIKLSNEMSSLEDDVQELIKDVRDPRYLTINEDNEPTSNDSLSLLKSKIHSTQVELKNYIAYTHKQAYTDSLTGLGNRTAYFDKVKNINSRLEEKDLNFLLIVYDLNGLKEINDTHGHENGDEAIRETGKLITELFGEGNSYRIGGDEFVSIIENYNEDEIVEKLNVFDNKVKEYNDSNAFPFELSISYGRALFRRKRDKVYSDVFRVADERMYTVKTEYYKISGKNRRKI